MGISAGGGSRTKTSARLVCRRKCQLALQHPHVPHEGAESLRLVRDACFGREKGGGTRHTRSNMAYASRGVPASKDTVCCEDREKGSGGKRGKLRRAQWSLVGTSTRTRFIRSRPSMQPDIAQMLRVDMWE